MSLIKEIRTVRLKNMPNLLWVEIDTDEGLTGLGEVFRGADAVESIIHNQLAPTLLGKDSRSIEAISRALMTPYLGFHSSGAETRAASAVDIALWDLKGKRHGIPVHEALGGACREQVKIYNTCAGYSYNTSSSSYSTGVSRRMTSGGEAMSGPYDDQIAFMKDAGELARSLVDEGYFGMKIWPFDSYATANHGTSISLSELKKGLEPFAKARKAVGDSIEIMAELHSLWAVQPAIRIAHALEDYGVFWVEDPICKMDDVESLAFVRASVRTPICGSETLAGLPTFRRLFACNAVDVAMLDLSWCGGLTEGRKICALAEANAIPVTPHDCTGPVVLWAGVHMSFHSPMVMCQEVVRANMATWYTDLVDNLPVVANGVIGMPTLPGLGVTLKPEVKRRPDAIVVTSGK